MNEFKVVLCPSCGKENHINVEIMIDNVVCEFCQTELKQDSEQINQTIESSLSESICIDQNSLPYSSVRPFWYVALMMMMTLGLYKIVWLYRSWQILYQHYNLRNNIILNIFLDPFSSFKFFRYAFLIGQEGGYKPFMPKIIYPILYFIFLISASASSKLMGDEIDCYAIYMVIFLALLLIPIHGAVKAINAGYTLVEPDTRIRKKLSPWSIVFICLGSFFWLAFIIIYLDFFHVITIE